VVADSTVTAVRVLTEHLMHTRFIWEPGATWEYRCSNSGCDWSHPGGRAEHEHGATTAFARHLVEQLAAARIPPTLEAPRLDEGLRDPHVAAWLEQDREQQRADERRIVHEGVQAAAVMVLRDAAKSIPSVYLRGDSPAAWLGRFADAIERGPDRG
jgi:ADP-ribose pyrophosphatase YjhB (NUDIX family)